MRRSRHDPGLVEATAALATALNVDGLDSYVSEFVIRRMPRVTMPEVLALAREATAKDRPEAGVLVAVAMAMNEASSGTVTDWLLAR